MALHAGPRVQGPHTGSEVGRLFHRSGGISGPPRSSQGAVESVQRQAVPPDLQTLRGLGRPELQESPDLDATVPLIGLASAAADLSQTSDQAPEPGTLRE